MENTTSARVRKMMAELDVDQPTFARLADTSKSMVNHWLTGMVKTITAVYAFNLQKTTGYSAEWIQTGAGDPLMHKGNNLVQPVVYQSAFGPEIEKQFRDLTPAGRKMVLTQLKIAIETAKVLHGSKVQQKA